MKHIIIAMVILIALASCRKDYTCECKTKSSYPGQPAETSRLTNTGKMKKEDARKKCNEGDGSGTMPYFNPSNATVTYYPYTTECEMR